ncbi:MAG: bifunctional phosphoglucose/phosphomannose isomerase [Promethearchaeia archaeon]
MQENVDITRNSMSSLVDAFFSLLAKKRLQENTQQIAEKLAIPKTEGICTVGMGGSSIAGQIAIALLNDSSSIPLTFVRDYQLPAFIDDRWTVITVSYSGTTEETLSAYNDADSRGCELFSVTTGGELGALCSSERTHVLPKGIQPRAALPMILAAVLPLMQCLLGNRPTDFEHLSEKLTDRQKELKGSMKEPQEIATHIHQRIPAFIGWRHLAPVAYRAKTQINENAKSTAYSLELPEANHNEIEASAAYANQSIAPILLRSTYEDEQTRRRFEATSKILEQESVEVESIQFSGESKLEEVLYAIQYLDAVSVRLADIRGVNPMGVPQISLLKAILAGNIEL